MEKTKRPRNVGSSGGSWEDMNPEILALIFTRIPADELVRAVPFVCKSWEEVVAGPYCWSEIDVEQWCRRCNNSGCIEFAVRKLVKRSNGSCRRLSAFKLRGSGFSYVADCVNYLQVLQIPMSDVTDEMLKRHVQSLKQLKILDISCCLKITCKGIETLGQHCKSLVHLKRNMPPPEWQHDIGKIALKTDNEEALAIAYTMPTLHHLELGYGCLTDLGLDAIFTNCKKLTHLDIIGCNGVTLEGDFEDKCNRLVMFRPPWDDEYQGDASDSSDDDEEYPSSESEGA